MVDMQKDCRPLLRIPAPAALVHLTSKDGGNAEGLLGTIPAMHVRTILALSVAGATLPPPSDRYGLVNC